MLRDAEKFLSVHVVHVVAKLRTSSYVSVHVAT